MTEKGIMEILNDTPSLMHRDAFDDEEEVISGGVKGDDRHPADRWKSYLYIEGGRVVMPEANIKAALELAGAQIKAKGRATLKRPIVAGLFFTEPFLPFLVGQAATDIGDISAVLKTYREITIDEINAIQGKFSEQVKQAAKIGITLDVRRVKIGPARHIRVRPRFDLWGVRGEFETVLEELTPPRVTECFRLSGRIAGLMDYRPSSPKRAGSFGRYRTKITYKKN